MTNVSVKVVANFTIEEENLPVYGPELDDGTKEVIKEDVEEQLKNMFHELDFVENVKFTVAIN